MGTHGALLAVIWVMVWLAVALRRLAGTPFQASAGSALRKLVGYVGKETRWYLVAWCRRRDAMRVFRTDRISSVSILAEVPAPRPLSGEDLDIPQQIVHQLLPGSFLQQPLRGPGALRLEPTPMLHGEPGGRWPSGR